MDERLKNVLTFPARFKAASEKRKCSKVCEHFKYKQVVADVLFEDLTFLFSQITVTRSGIAALLDEEVACDHTNAKTQKNQKDRLLRLSRLGQQIQNLFHQVEEEVACYQAAINKKP